MARRTDQGRVVVELVQLLKVSHVERIVQIKQQRVWRHLFIVTTQGGRGGERARWGEKLLGGEGRNLW